MSQTNRPNPYDPHDPHRSSEIMDPVARLQQLKNELADRQRQIDHLDKQSTDLQTDITDLSQTVQDVTTTLADYGGQVKNLELSLHALQYFYDQKHKMVMAAIGDKKGPIDELIREFDYETDMMQGRLDELDGMVESAQLESQRATDNQNAKQTEYNAVKGYSTAIQANLTDLEALRTSITTADTNTDTASEYFLVLEFQYVLGETDIVSQHQLALELKQKLGELEQAKEQARAKSSELNKLQNDQTAQKTALTTRRQSRRQQLLAEIQKLYPVQDPMPASGTAAAGSAGTTGAAAPAATTAAPAGSSSPTSPASTAAPSTPKK